MQPNAPPPVYYPEPRRNKWVPWLIAGAVVLGVPVIMLGALFIFILGACGFFK